MADSKKKDVGATDDLGRPANQESSIREAKGDEKPDPTSVVNVEEVKSPNEG